MSRIEHKFDLGEQVWVLHEETALNVKKDVGCSFCDYHKVIIIKDIEFPCPACQTVNRFSQKLEACKDHVFGMELGAADEVWYKVSRGMFNENVVYVSEAEAELALSRLETGKEIL